MTNRYNTSIIIIHWLMALLLFFMLSSGFLMVNTEINPSLKFKLYQWHKSSGVLLIILVILRIIAKIFTTNPKLPKDFSKIEIILAKISHLLLYLFMILAPLTGWAMVSSSPYGVPTIVFDLFEWPHIPNIAGNEKISNLAKNLHFFILLLFLPF